MKQFGHPDSGHAFKVRFLLSAAGIAHDYELVDIFAPCESRSEEFREHARYGEVPLLLHEGRSYVQSNAILIHLATLTGQWGAQNEDSFQRCLEWLNWEANKIGMCLPQLRAARRVADHGINDGALQWLQNRYQHDVGILNIELTDGRPYILGAQPTIADFSLCGYLFFANEAQVEVPTNVQAWLERLSALPGWQHPYDLMSELH